MLAIKLIAEGLGLGFLLYLICATGIHNGAVGMVHLYDQEMHSEVEYVVAHGIASMIGGERAVIGSRHFIFEDEAVRVLPEDQDAFDSLAPDCSCCTLPLAEFCPRP